MDPPEIKQEHKNSTSNYEKVKEGQKNPFGLDSLEMQEPIPHKESVSKFFDGQEEKNMLKIKHDLMKGLKRTEGRNIQKSKMPLNKRRMAGMNPGDIKVKIFLPNLSKLLSNDTKDKALQEILKLFNDTGTKPECLKVYLQELLKRRISKKGLINFEMEIIALNHLICLNGENFIDPRSKVNTLESTIKKVTDLYKIALSLEYTEVHKAVAQGYIHILES